MTEPHNEPHTEPRKANAPKMTLAQAAEALAGLVGLDAVTRRKRLASVLWRFLSR